MGYMPHEIGEKPTGRPEEALGCFCPHTARWRVAVGACWGLLCRAVYPRSAPDGLLRRAAKSACPCRRRAWLRNQTLPGEHAQGAIRASLLASATTRTLRCRRLDAPGATGRSCVWASFHCDRRFTSAGAQDVPGAIEPDEVETVLPPESLRQIRRRVAACSPATRPFPRFAVG